MTSTARILVAVFTLVALGCAFSAYQSHAQLTAAEQQVAALQQKIATLEKAAVAQTSRLSPLQVTDAHGKSTLTGPMPLGPGSPSFSAMRGEANPGGGPAMGSAMNSPEMQQLMAIQQRSVLDSRYAALFRQLKLSPADLETFKKHLVDRQTAAFDVRAAMQSQGMNVKDGRDVMRELLADAQAEVDESIRKTLGDSVYEKYKVYERTLPERSVANQLEQRLSYTTSPLNGDQVERLVVLMTEMSAASGTNPAGGTATPVSGPIASPLITSATITRSEGFLNSEQLAALRQLQQEQEARSQLAQKFRAPSGPPLPAPGSNRTSGPTPSGHP